MSGTTQTIYVQIEPVGTVPTSSVTKQIPTSAQYLGSFLIDGQTVLDTTAGGGGTANVNNPTVPEYVIPAVNGAATGDAERFEIVAESTTPFAAALLPSTANPAISGAYNIFSIDGVGWYYTEYAEALNVPGNYVIPARLNTPVITAPATATVNVGQTGPISGISIAESPTTANETFTVTVTDTNGILVASGATGSGTTSLKISGSLNSVNAVLASLTDNDTKTPSDTITITANDSNSHSAMAATVAVTVNGASVITAPGTATVGVGKTAPISGVSISESPTTGNETFTVTVSDTNGILAASGAAGSGTTSLTISGSLDTVNAALASLTDTDGITPSDSITVTATDSNNQTATPASVAVTVNGVPVITAPTTATPPSSQTMALAGISIAETGDTTTSGETFTVTLTDATDLLSATGTGVSGSGTTGLTITGTLAQVNAGLATLMDNYGAADTITISAKDSFGNVAASRGIAVTAPVPLTGPLLIKSPPAAGVYIGQSTAISGVGIVETPSLANETFTVTLTDTNGVLSANTSGAGGGGSVISSAGGKTLTIGGTLAQVNAGLATLAEKDASPAADTITITAKDSLGAVTSKTMAITTSPAVPTAAQIKLVTNDVMRFYADVVGHKSVTADLAKLTTDVTGLNLTQATLGQVLTAALQNPAGVNAATLANDIAGIYYPKIASDLSHNGAGLPGDLSAMVAETAVVGIGYHALAAHESASAALQQTVALFRL